MLLMGLLTSVLSYTLAHSFSRSYVTLLCRAFLFWVDFFGLTRTLDNNHFEADAAFLRWVPGNNQTDSIIVLPAFCLLEGSFDPLQDLVPEQRLHLTNNGVYRATDFQIKVICSLGGVTFGVAILCILAYIWNNTCGSDKHHRAAMIEKKEWPKWTIFLWAVVRVVSWFVCTGFIIWNWIAIAHLRSWVNGSDWLQLEDGLNPEYTIKSIGQLAPLVALGTIGLTFTNSFRILTKTETAAEEWIELQDGTYQWKPDP